MNKYLKYLCLLGLLVSVTACSGDNSAGPDPAEAPSLPEIQYEKAQPDLSFFENNQPKTIIRNMQAAGDTANYYEARNWALLRSATFAFTGIYNGFLTAGNQEDAVYEDGTWTWEYSYQYEQQSVSIKLTSEEVAGGYKWAMYWSFNDGNTSYENYKMLEGTVSGDGSEGNWSFNTLNPDTNQEELAYTSKWTVTSDTEKTMTVKWYDSGNVMLTADYEEKEPDHTLTFTYPGDPDVTLYWNSDSREGYIEQGSERKCWDQDFKDVSCS